MSEVECRWNGDGEVCTSVLNTLARNYNCIPELV